MKRMEPTDSELSESADKPMEQTAAGLTEPAADTEGADGADGANLNGAGAACQRLHPEPGELMEL